MAVSGRLRAATGGAPLLPLVVLFAFNLVDEFDRVAFGVLSPELRDAFGLSDSGIVAVGSLAGVTALLAALPVGVLADRVRRVRLAGAGAVGWTAATVLTALAPTAGVLTAARMLGGIGRIVNEPVHASLLTDYYAPAHHPRVFALHRLANPLGVASALAVGLLAAVLDWRLVFLLLGVPTLLLLPVLLRLREPVRGESLAPAAAARAAALDTPTLTGACRQLCAVRTLRRLWLALPVLGVAILTLPQLITLFFEREYGYGTTGRGVVTALSGLGIVVGLGLGQRLASRALAEGRPERLATYDGLAVAGIGLGLVAMVLSPLGWLSAVANLATGIAVGAYQPCWFSLVALVSPPRVRAQAYAYAILLLGGGGLLAPGLAALGQDTGYRAALGVLAVVLLVGGAVTTTAARHVRADAAAAAGEEVMEPAAVS